MNEKFNIANNLGTVDVLNFNWKNTNKLKPKNSCLKIRSVGLKSQKVKENC